MGRKRCADERMDQIYKYIKEFLIEKGYPPSVREIGKAVGLKSSSTVHGYLNQLEAAGLIRRDPTKPRAIDLLEDKPWERTVNVPLIGTVTAGTPILAQENVEEVFAFPQGLLGTTSETFMLRIDGDSMINAGIFDGDYIMVRQQNTANNSDIVVDRHRKAVFQGEKSIPSPAGKRLHGTILRKECHHSWQGHRRLPSNVIINQKCCRIIGSIFLFFFYQIQTHISSTKPGLTSFSI